MKQDGQVIAAVLAAGVREQIHAWRNRQAAGKPRGGWKVCVNDPGMQKKLGLERSFVGCLDGSRELASGDRWIVGEGSMLAVEPEFAIRFSADVPPQPGPEDIRAAIEGVAAAIEVVDWKNAKPDLMSIAASSSCHAGYVVGELRPFADVPAIGGGCPLFLRGEEVLGVPDPALVPADLLELVAGVVEFLTRHGESIQAGDWLLCGACTSPARVEAGDSVEADFATLGSVRVEFA